MRAKGAEELGGADSIQPFVEVDVLRGDLNAARKFPSNHVRTSKYTLLTCWPKSLLDQFRCVSNIYFLFVTIITLIPTVSPVDPLSTLIPLCIVVGAGMWKDLWEDGKRRKSDKVVNSMGVWVLRGFDFTSVASRDVQAGDVMLCKLGDEVLADAVVLNTSLADGVTYIETANLDGETNAKTRRAKRETIDSLGTVEDIIENCLPDTEVRAHFLGCKSLSGRKRHDECSNCDGAAVDPALFQEVGRRNGTFSGTTRCPQVSPSSRFHDVEMKTAGDAALQSVGLPPPDSAPYSFYTESPNKVDKVECGGASAVTPTKPEGKGDPHHLQGLAPGEVIGCRETAAPFNGFSIPDTSANQPGSRSGFHSDPNPFAATSVYDAGLTVGAGCRNSSFGGAHDRGNLRGVSLLGSQPCPDLHSWIGQIRLRGGKVVPLSVDQFLPRGSIIRNTEWVLCAVMYTGSNTKMLLNLRRTREKASVTSRQINLINILLLVVHQVVLVTLCVMSLHWQRGKISAPEGVEGSYSTWYIQWALSRHQGPEYFALSYLTNFVLLSYLIPISLYVTLELNKVLQMFLISNDRRMASYDEFKGVLRYSKPNTSLNPQLAHVRYVFTDKTGTLTENVMTYVGGCTADERHDENERPGALGEAFLQLVESQQSGVTSSSEPMSFATTEHHRSPRHARFDFDEESMEKEPLYQYLRNLSLCHTVVSFNRPEVESAVAAAVEAAAASGHTVPAGSPPPGCSQAFTRRLSAVDAGLVTDRRTVSGTADAGDVVYQRQGSGIAPGNASIFGAASPCGVGRFLHGHTGSASWFMACHNDALMHERSLTMSRKDYTRASYHRQHQTAPAGGSPLRATRPSAASLGEGNAGSASAAQEGVSASSKTTEAVSGDDTSSSVGKGRDSFLLLVKGADSSMMSIMNKRSPRNVKLKEFFEVEIDLMAKRGLRTLVLGQRWVSAAEVRNWLAVFNDAQCRLHGRDEALHEAYALLEKDIDLIGTTAVSDQLQEGVPETVRFLMQANIVVWMLTGDKRETAVTIACTSGIIELGDENMVCHLDVCNHVSGCGDFQAEARDGGVREVLQLQLNAVSSVCDSAEEQHGRGTHKAVLVVDGLTLDVIFCDEGFTGAFFTIGARCRSAVCCRMTPLQKSKIVKLFQKETGCVVLAVGDGANDVSMIQESSVGVGIMGLEGSQAELASDYAIPRFRFLKRLIMVHGRFSLYRDAHCLVYSLHKNSLLTSGIVAYTVFSGFSGMIMIDSWFIALLNLIYCSLQPIVLGVYDKDVEDELAESLPLLYPPLARENMFFRWGYVTKWFVDGVVIGVAIFLFTWYIVGDDDALHPYRSGAVEDYGTLYFILMLVMVNLRAASALVCYNLVTFTVLVFCFVAVPVLTLFYSALPNVLGSNRCVYVAVELAGNIKLWLMLLICCGIYIMFIMGTNAYIELFKPWLNGERAMRAAWSSPYMTEHREQVKLLRQRSDRR